MELIQEKWAFDVRHKLALIVDEIYDALDGIIAALGFNVDPGLFIMVISGLNVLAAIIVYFLGPLVMFLDVLVALPPSCCERSFDGWWRIVRGLSAALLRAFLLSMIMPALNETIG